jgi:TonB family protein
MTFKRMYGWTTFLIRVDTTGRVVDVQLVKASYSVFVDSSAEALLNWRYEPLVLNGKPTCVEASVHFEYDAR